MALRYPGLNWLINWWIVGGGVAFPEAFSKRTMIRAATTWYLTTHAVITSMNEMIYQYLLNEYSGAPVDGDYYVTVLNDHPISFWQFNEPNGFSAFDAIVATSNVGEYNADASSFAPRITPLPSGLGITGNGVTGLRVVMPPNAAYDVMIAGPFSVEFWAKFGAGANAIVVDLRATGFSQLALMRRTGAQLEVTRRNEDSVSLVQPFPPAADDLWHHYVYTKNGDALTLYFDGVTVAAGVDPGGVYLTPTSIGALGNALANVDLFAGSVDELAFYGTALPPARVLAHFNARNVT